MICTSGRIPISAATRSECRPAQLMRWRVVTGPPPGPPPRLPRETAAAPPDTADARPRYDLRPPLGDERRHLVRHLGIVHDAGGGREHAAHRADMRLPLPHLVAGDELEPGHAVRGAALVQRGEPRDLLLLGGYDHLAAALVADAVGVAELRHEPGALHAQTRLE